MIIYDNYVLCKWGFEWRWIKSDYRIKYHYLQRKKKQIPIILFEELSSSNIMYESQKEYNLISHLMESTVINNAIAGNGEYNGEKTKSAATTRSENKIEKKQWLTLGQFIVNFDKHKTAELNVVCKVILSHQQIRRKTFTIAMHRNVRINTLSMCATDVWRNKLIHARASLYNPNKKKHAKK